MSITEVTDAAAQTGSAAPAQPTPEEEPDAGAGAGADDDAESATSDTRKRITARIASQVQKQFRDGTFGPDSTLNMGYKRKLIESLASDGYHQPVLAAEQIYRNLDNMIEGAKSLGPEGFSGPDEFVEFFSGLLDAEISEYV